MLSSKRHSTGPVILLILVVISLLTMSGCGAKNPPTSSTVSAPVFSKIDDQILKSAGAQYQTLRETLSPVEARTSLLKKLNSQEGVTQAKLGIDGSTIFIDYKDGDHAAVDTYESGEEPVSGASRSTNNELSSSLFMCASPFNLVSNLLDITKTEFAAQAAPTGSAIPITATSKKVLILSPITDLQSPRDCRDFFLQNGWPPADVTLKMTAWAKTTTTSEEDKSLIVTPNTTTTTTRIPHINPGALLVGPNDFFNMGNYGVIIINAHGGAKDNFNEDNIYLQCGTVSKEAFESNEGKNDYVRWKAEEKLLIEQCGQTAVSDDAYQVLIRGDLLREKLPNLASSYVEMATCWGYAFKSIFIDKGAQRFLSWDNSVPGFIADPDQSAMIDNMLSGKSVEDAYLDDSIVRSGYAAVQHIDSVPKDLIISPASTNSKTMVTYNLKSYADSTSFYLPAWINLKITGSKQLAGIKEGVTSLAVSAINETLGGGGGSALKLASGQTEAALTLERGWGNSGGEYILAQILDDQHKSGNFLLPGHYKISVEASNTYYFGGALSAGDIDVDIHCGTNDVQVQLTDLIWDYGEYTGPSGWQGVEPTIPASSPATLPPTSTVPPASPTATASTSPSPSSTESPTPSPTKPAQTRLKELSHDDGEAEGWVSLGGSKQYGFLDRFTTTPSFNVTTIRIYNKIKSTPNPDSKFTVRITDKDLVPKWEVSLPMTLFTIDPSWFDIQVPELTVKDAFCVLVYAPSLGQGLGPYIGVDESGPNVGSETLSGWQMVPWAAAPAKETCNWMIRAVGYAMTP